MIKIKSWEELLKWGTYIKMNRRKGGEIIPGCIVPHCGGACFLETNKHICGTEIEVLYGPIAFRVYNGQGIDDWMIDS